MAGRWVSSCLVASAIHCCLNRSSRKSQPGIYRYRMQVIKYNTTYQDALSGNSPKNGELSLRIRREKAGEVAEDALFSALNAVADACQVGAWTHQGGRGGWDGGWVEEGAHCGLRRAPVPQSQSRAPPASSQAPAPATEHHRKH